MRLISWDIGTTNLAYCIIDYVDNEYEIIKWNKIDIFEDLKEKKHYCDVKQKNGKICHKLAKYGETGTEIYYCKRHTTNSAEVLNADKICSVINKNKKQCSRKATLYEGDDDKKYYCNFHKKQATEPLSKIVNIKTASFFEKSLFIPKIIDNDPELLDVDDVLIENQPIKINPVMKSIQMILYTTYLIRGIIDKTRVKEVHLINATQKMKIYDGPKIECAIKNKHDRNKFLAIKYCEYFIDGDNLEYFLTHDKKDDLADSFLQGLYFIKTSSGNDSRISIISSKVGKICER